MLRASEIPDYVNSNLGSKTPVDKLVIEKLGGYFSNTAKRDDSGASLVPFNKLLAPLPMKKEISCLMIVWIGLALCWYLMEYKILGKGIVVIGPTLILVSVALWQMARFGTVKRHYNVKQLSAIIINNRTIKIPGFYTHTRGSASLAIEHIKEITIDWDFVDGRKTANYTPGRNIGLQGAKITLSTGRVYEFPFWQTASYVLINALVNHGYCVNLVKVNYAASSVWGALRYLLANALVIGLGWFILSMLFGL